MSDTSLVFNLVTRDRATQALGSVKDKFKAASAAIGAAMGIGVASAVTTSLDMSAANSKLAAQLGVGSVEAGKLATTSASIYKNAWGTSTSDVNDAIRSVYQNIGDSSTAQGGLEGVTTKVLALRDTFDVDLGETTAAIGQMMKTGLAKNSTEAMDIITAGLQKGADKSGDFLATLNEYGTQFRKVGVDGQMATGLISQGLKAGARDSDLVADSIKEFSIRAVDGSKTTAAGFKAIGLDAGDMASRIGKGGKSANDALDQTLDHLRGIHDPVKRSAAAVQLFGTQAEDMGAALYALDPSSAVQALGQVGGAADKMAKTVGDNPAAALEHFKRTAIVATSDVAGKLVSFAMKNQQVFGPLAGLLGGVAVAVLAVSAAEKVYNAGKTIGTVVTKIWNASIWESNAALLANPVTWIVIGIIALIAVIVIIATKTTWFQTIWRVVWGGIKSATAAVWGWLKGVFHWFSTLPGLVGGWIAGVYHGIVNWLTSAVNWVRGLPGRIVGAISSLGSRLWNAAKNGFVQFMTAQIKFATSAVNWAKGLPGRIINAVGGLGSRLYNAGRSLLMGFWNGIKNFAGTLYNNVSGVVGKVRDFFPFSPAKVGPFSGSGYTTYSGQALVSDFAKGITSRAAVATDAMTGVTASVAGVGAQTTATAPRTVAAPMSRGAAAPRTVVEFRFSGDEDMVKLMRKAVRTRGGNVQVVFGT